MARPARGNLPKAYLRLDPNIDQTHPDNLDGFVRLLCAACRQPERGTFRSRAVLEALFGKTVVVQFLNRRDVAIAADGKVTVPGWDIWQEGDLTVGERVRRFRDKHVTEKRAGNGDVTPDVTPPALPAALPDRNSPSEASRRLGVKAYDSLSEEDRASHVVARPDVGALLARGWKLVTPKQLAMLDEMADRHDRPSKGDAWGAWAADVIRTTGAGRDPIAELKLVDSAWQEVRRQEIDAEERRLAEEKAERLAAPVKSFAELLGPTAVRSVPTAVRSVPTAESVL